MEKIVKENTLKKKIDFLKTACLISGIILVIIYYAGNNAIEDAMNEKIKSLNLSYNPYSQSFEQKMNDPNYFKISSIKTDYQFYSTVISIIAKVFAVFLCVRFAKYVKGHWTIWAILAFCFPYLTLIIISFIPLKKEFMTSNVEVI